MKTTALKMVFGLIILPLIFSCKAYRNVENLKPTVSRELQEGPFVKESLSKLNEGDKVMVHLITGEKNYLYFKQINGKDLMGTLWKKDGEKVQPNQRIEIPIDYIEKVYVYRKSAGATIPVVIIGGMVAAAGIFLLVFAIGGGIDLGF